MKFGIIIVIVLMVVLTGLTAIDISALQLLSWKRRNVVCVKYWYSIKRTKYLNIVGFVHLNYNRNLANFIGCTILKI